MSMLNKTASVGSVLGRDKSPQKEHTALLFGVPFHTILPGKCQQTKPHTCTFLIREVHLLKR